MDDQSTSTLGKSGPSQRRCCILLVEDHPDTLNALRRLIERKGHTVLRACTCAEAEALAADAKAKGTAVDLIIGDIGLPDGDGVQLICDLKALLGCPAVALTGYGMSDDIRRCAEAGIERHLLKPVGSLQLDAEMKRLVDC